MLNIPGRWIWDFWLARSADEYHIFYLHAPDSVLPDDRHFVADIGHAVSTDLSDWTVLPKPFGPAEPSSYDSRARWTGSVLGLEGRWLMFRTGLAEGSDRLQRLGLDVSDDLHTWRQGPGNWPIEADTRWYDDDADDQHWRDPWVMRGPDGRWLMYVTARTAGEVVEGGPGRGVVGLLTSDDLAHWRAEPPLSEPAGFEEVEVIQLEEIDGRWVLIFSCLGLQLAPRRPGSGGIWSVPIEGPGSPVDLTRAVRLADEAVYSGRLARGPDGRWVLLAFVNKGPQGEFRGGVIDPVPVTWRADGTGLELAHPPVPWSVLPD